MILKEFAGVEKTIDCVCVCVLGLQPRNQGLEPMKHLVPWRPYGDVSPFIPPPPCADLMTDQVERARKRARTTFYPLNPQRERLIPNTQSGCY